MTFKSRGPSEKPSKPFAAQVSAGDAFPDETAQPASRAGGPLNPNPAGGGPSAAAGVTAADLLEGDGATGAAGADSIPSQLSGAPVPRDGGVDAISPVAVLTAEHAEGCRDTI